MLSIFVALLIAFLVCYATALLSLRKPNGKQPLLAKFIAAGERYTAPKQPSKIVSTDSRIIDSKPPVRLDHEDASPEMSAHKDMYYKLHNLEEFPDLLPRARNQLIAFFAETLDTASKERPDDSILRLNAYSREELTSFMRDQDEKVNQQWEDYVARRKKGGHMELFKDKDEARWWLKQIAPVKYVDGAWLGYVNKITLPFALRPVIKNSWQVLSEELGDGDLDKNHAHVYRELMKSVTLDLPAGDTADFIHPRYGMNEPAVWKAALAQLLISLIPHEFFPEILGFNMHFEALTLETLKASRELKEVDLDPYYFMLHVSIDNADSGHTAIAQQAVCMYIEHIHRAEGATAAQQAWRRVQVGYTLSDGLSGKAICPSMRKPAVDSFPRNELEAEVIKIFKAKALVGHKIHSHSDIKIGGKKLLDWLDPAYLDSKQWQMDFLHNFSRSKSWVYRGDSSKSRFVKELSWEGRMFGAFTKTETDAVKKWIDMMPSSRPQHYWDFTGREDDLTSPTDSRIDLSLNYPNSQSLKALENLSSAAVSSRLELPAAPFGLKFGVNEMPDPAKFLPLWFTHPCLLETFISIPWKTTSPFACSIVRILRAQAGFDNEFGVVAGMDEANKTDNLGLVEIGQELLRKWGFPEVGSLNEVLEKWGSQSAATMAQLAMRPLTNKGLLIGMAMAFTSLHGELASSNLLCQGSKDALSNITRRETENLEECLKELDESKRRHCSRGYWFAATQLKSCFGEFKR
ncbi:hypothetical protein OEA41_008591 [Lepraria neglecta]|uniref:Uncharacterized protein n=1 Tax=Lepraria neglecta TaxID=209136 RepID=A0AAD9Z4B1_9LECA|nr:hypothetical protein OEA41_008591 [Lepraria neglecta]